jgi:hypothetical protein
MQENAAPSLPEVVWEQLSRWGLLLEQDKVLPSVASIIAGGPIAGSWWGSAASSSIYDACQALEEMANVLRVKLVSGKVTFVLERLWPAVFAVARSREPWQLEGLTPEDVALLGLVDDAGLIRLDELPGASKRVRESARTLERRLLVYGDQLHTDSGAHTKVLQSWASWVEAGRRVIDDVAVEHARRFSKKAWR